MNVQEATQVLAMLKAAYPRQEVTGETAQVYCQFLCDLDPQDAMEAARAHIATSKFWPSIAELRTLATAALAAAPLAGEAWEQVLDAVGRYGRYRLPRFEHPLVGRVVDQIGWEAICDSEMIGVERAHFLKCYEAASEKSLNETNTRPLIEATRKRALGALNPMAALKLAEGGGNDD